MKKINLLLSELERCELNDPTINGGAGEKMYNGTTFVQSEICYQQRLKELFDAAVSEVSQLADKEIKVIMTSIERIKTQQTYFDVPTRANLQGNEKEMIRNSNPSLRDETEFIRFVIACVDMQKTILTDFSVYIEAVRDVCQENSITKNDIANKMSEPVQTSYNNIKTKKEEIQPNKKKVNYEVEGLIQRGVRGLAKLMNCGTTEAQQILNSGILQNKGIAYKVGRVWNINSCKLDNALSNNPYLLDGIRANRKK